jgi:hypothetical protein
MKHTYLGHKSNPHRLGLLGKIIDTWRSHIFFLAHLGYSQWEVEMHPQRTKANNIQSIHSANTRK